MGDLHDAKIDPSSRTLCKMDDNCNDPKRESCIPWNPTSPKEAHENVFIRNNLPSMCRGSEKISV